MYHRQARKNSKIMSPKTQFIRWAIFVIVALFLSVGAWIGYTMYTSINKITADSGKNSVLSLFDAKKMLKGQAEGRTNVLLLGNGGANHPGGGLTDTMIMLSIDWQTKKMAMISVPRDLWVKMPNGSYAKLNYAYFYGNQNPKVSGGGGKVASDVITQVLGQPVDYYISLDFDGFKKMVDTLGGLDIYVDKALYDPYYPAANMIDYDPLKIAVGQTHMDGKLALKYARSRETTSDFDRSRRQQQVILATKTKAVSLGTLSNPKKVTDLITILGDHLRTSMTVPEIISLFDEIKSIDSENMINKTFDTAAGSPLTSLSGDERGYIIVPKKGIGVYTDLQTIAKNIFLPEAVVEPNYKIEVLNGTGKTGVATKISQTLKTNGYATYKIGNSATVKIPQTIIYNCAGPTASATTKKIASLLSGVEKTKTDCGVIDIQILVGESSL